MHTKRFLILQKLNEKLANIPNVQAVYSQIELPIDRSEVPAINISWSNENYELFGDDITRINNLNLTISIICRGENWQEQSDLISLDMHTILIKISDSITDIYQIFKKSTTIEQHIADTTCGVLSHEYVIKYYDNINN